MEASVESEILDPVNPAVLVFVRRFADSDHGRGLQHLDRSAGRCRRWVIPLGNWAMGRAD